MSPLTISADEPASVNAPDFTALRREFPTLERWTYLDIGRKAPMPLCAEAAAREFFEDIYVNAGERAFSMEAIDETRAALAELLGVQAGELAFVKNTSEGINIAVQALPLGTSDNVVTTAFEHEAQTFPLQVLAERAGTEIRVVPSEAGRMSVASILARMDDRTRLCAVSHVAFGNGFRVDLEALAEECRKRDVLLLSDVIQSVGILSTPVSRLADIAVAGCHKGLLGVNGTAFLYCGSRALDRMRPSLVGKHSVLSDRLASAPLRFRRDARRFEYGNPNFLGIAILAASVRLLRSVGLPAIEARVSELATTLIANARDRGVSVRTPETEIERAGIVSFATSDTESARARLAAARIVANLKDGNIRASIGFYNTPEDLDRFLDAMVG